MAPSSTCGVVATASPQSMLAKATEALVEAVKATGEGPNEFALYLLELLEVSAKISELSDVKAAAKQTAVSSEAKKWQELSLLTLQFCADGLNEQQSKLVRNIGDMASKGASLSRSTATAISAGPSPALPSVLDMLASIPIMHDPEPRSKARTPPPAMEPPPEPKLVPTQIQKGSQAPRTQTVHSSQQKPRATQAPGTPPKSAAKGKAKSKQQALKQQAKQGIGRAVAQPNHGSPGLSPEAAEFHPVSTPPSKMPNFDCYDEER